jgi:hypothetical protein
MMPNRLAHIGWRPLQRTPAEFDRLFAAEIENRARRTKVHRQEVRRIEPGNASESNEV